MEAQANDNRENPEQMRYAALVADDFVPGEILYNWSARQNYRHIENVQKAEVLKLDVILGELLYRQKLKLSHLGRSGGWKSWLDEYKIPRATADRLVLEHAEYYSLTDELPHRNIAEPLEGRICQSASRVSERVETMLTSPLSRMSFLRCLADLLELSVDYDGDTVRLSVPPPFNENDWKNEPVPPIFDMLPDGTPRPVSYELRDEEAGSPL